MFPRLRQRIGTAVLDRVDLVVELSTLGEYGLAEDGRPIATAAEHGLAGPSGRSRDVCPWRDRSVPMRCDSASRP